MDPYELMQISDLISNNLDNNIFILNLAFINVEVGKKKLINQKYKKFIKIYCATVILVISQFFENPYY